MKPKNIIPIIIFFLIINIAVALDYLRPEIEVIFDERVDQDTIDISLSDSLGVLFLTLDNGLELVSSDNPTFVYRPVVDLPEGFYTVRAQAEDEQGILGPLIELNFPIQIPPLDIRVVEPSLGVSPVTPFDFNIMTDRWANCKYSFLDQSYDDMASAFSTDDNLLHKEADFDKTGTIYVKCKDEYDKITSKSFMLLVDASPPDIIYKHADDVTEAPISTTLIVRTNEDTVCKYYFEDSEIDYDDMNPFPDYDETNENSYKLEHQQDLDGGDLIDHQVNRYYLRCKNKAEFLSVMEYVDINVDTTTSPIITVNTPGRYITDTTPLFDVTTNKDSTCRVADNSDMDNAVSMEGTGNYHSKELSGELSSGEYTYYVECIFAVEGAIQTSVTFSIDDSPPSMLYVNMIPPSSLEKENITGKTYKDDELCAEWEAEDNESSIELYAYYVYWDKSTDELIESGTTGSDEECVDVELNDTEKYYFTVSVQNGAGLWSDNLSSSSIEVDVSLAPSSCVNNRKDDDETDVDCGGGCDGCAIGENCLLNSDCDSRYCNASNKCASPRCDDDVRNGGETDVDCGGSCKKCDVGKFCNKDRDCKTNNCDVSTGKCASVLDRCENNQLDADETDIDCGGSCPACGIGKNCDSDSDCIATAKCEDGACALDSDGDGVVDDNDNCPDIANEDQADVEGDGIGDACDPDSDNDNLPDSFEQQYFDCVTCADPDDDPDKDGLTNLDEYKYNTNPTKRDTDEDGYSDGEEIEAGTDPLDPSSHPGGGFLKYLLIILGLGVLGAGGYFGYKMFIEKKKPFIPPKMPVAKKLVRRPLAGRRPMGARRPIRPFMRRIRRPIARPFKRMIKPAPKITAKKPEEVKKGVKVEKPKLEVKQPQKKKEENIFKKLSEISKTERLGQVEKKMETLKLTDRELEERIGKLKKELKVK